MNETTMILRLRAIAAMRADGEPSIAGDAANLLEKLIAERDAALAKREAVPANTEPATDNEPAYVTLSEYGAICALNTLAALSDENESARAVVGPVIADLRIALCRPWKPAKREAVTEAISVHCPDCGWKGSTTSELHDDVEGDLLCPRAGCTGVLAASQQAAKGEGT